VKGGFSGFRRARLIIIACWSDRWRWYLGAESTGPDSAKKLAYLHHITYLRRI
jgi:hypothetical protein